jgi:1,4-dihydroxy-2-naphthoate polyprenyltransferase
LAIIDLIYHNIGISPMLLRNLINFIRLTRPHFLVGGAMLYALGVALAYSEGHKIRVMSYIIGQLVVTIIQLMTHYVNEYYDLESDAINQSRTWFSGGSGMLSAGAFSPRFALKVSVILAVLAALLIGAIGLGMVMPATALLCLLALGLAWFYSAPPLRLCASGFGELSASLVVTVLVPLVGYSLQTSGVVHLELILGLVPLFLLHFAMLIAFQIPDYAADLAVNKKTLAVRLGLRLAIQVHNLLLILAYCSVGVLLMTHWPRAALLFVPLPLAAWQFLTIHHFIQRAIRGYLPLTLRAIGLFAVTSTLTLAAYLIIY